MKERKYQKTKKVYSDDIALKDLKNADEKAYTWIYNKYFNQLCDHAAKVTENIETSEDIVQDIFVKLWQERKTTIITISLRAYLYTCVRNKWKDYLDHIKVQHIHEESFWDENNDLPYSNNPESMLIAKEMECIINDKINTLPEQCKLIFSMWWKDGLKYDEIAKKTSISIGTVKVQINRARTKLREALENTENMKK